jgi:signal transduction histidine kinase
VFGNLLGETGLTPHGFCLSWNPDLLALQIVADALIGIAYCSIPLALTVFVIRRKDLAFRGVFWLFVIFILACASTHFMSIWTIWHPDYGAEGMVKAVTAVASILTAIQLWPLLPRALALPSPAALRDANEQLRQQIRQRDEAVAALRRATIERERAEEMLRHAQKMEAIGQLTGGIAHDFNNLLTVVIANLEMLQRRLSPDAGLRTYVERAMKGAARGATVTQQLLAFARRQPLQPVVFDAARRVGGLADLLRGTLGSGIELEIVAIPDLWPVEADPNQLESALLNLAINARDAMRDGGRLTVAAGNVTLRPASLGVADASGADEPADFVAISVADTGTGMTDEVRRTAFDPFVTTKPVGQGSGLGLSQVYGFVKQSRGHVTLDSEPGRGTKVTLFLPRATAAPADSDGLVLPQVARAITLR